MEKDQLGRMPKELNCCAIMYRVTEVEDCIIFSVKTPCWGCDSRIKWERKNGCWYVNLQAAAFDGSTMFAHLMRQYREIKNVYGGDFEYRT